MSNNILSFPKDKVVREYTQSSAMLEKLKSNSLNNFIECLVQEITENIITEFSTNGLDLTNESFDKDINFLVTIINATVCRTVNIEHPFHKFIDDNVVMNDKESEVEN